METMSGSEFKRRRRALKLTQAELAERIGVHKRTLSRWEYGAYPVPSLGSVALAAIEAGITVQTSGKRSRARRQEPGAEAGEG